MTATSLTPRAARSRRSRRPSGDDRERDILATAERLLEERRFHEICVDDLARGAGISRPSFYFYFPSKDAVFLTLLDRVVEEARTTRDTALEGLAEDPARRWREALTAIHDTFGSHKGLSLVASEFFAHSGEARELWAHVMEGFVQETAAAIEAERARGAAPTGAPARDIAIALNWMNERVLHTTFTGQAPALDDEVVIDVLLEVWLRAIYGRTEADSAAERDRVD
ncbi:MAG: TetR/AcrR family transcriptional regulator [Acidimicrobiales bacterium]